MKKIYALLFVLTSSFSFFAQEASYVPGELLIQIGPSVKVSELIRKLETELNIDISESECVSDIMRIHLLKFEDKSINLSDISRAFVLYDEIMTVQKNHLVFERETIPSDTLFDTQWHHKNTGQTGGTVDADMDSPEAWDITTGGVTTHDDTIVVCIIEGLGVDINHVDLKDNIWKNYAEIPGDLIDNDNNGYIDDFNGWHVIDEDDNIDAGSHGTRVAGMIGATGNNVTGVSGVNWNVKMMIVQGQSASVESTVIAAYTYPLKMRKRYNETLGQEGAFVVATNASWGINGGDPADSPLWCAMYDSLGYYGILNIGATTNNNSNVDVVGDLPTTCASEFLVAVTMTSHQDLRANSGYGTTHVDIGAPGQNVRTTAIGNAYTITSGTSFATPAVVGCVALAYSAPCAEFINYVKYNPAGAAMDMRHYLLSSVDQNASLQAEVASGGRANVRRYIDSLLADCDPATCIAPYDLTVISISDTSAEISWSGFSTDYVFYIQQNGGSLNQIDASGLNTITVDTLLPCKNYTVYVQANCGTDSSVFSFPLNFKTDGCCNNPVLVVDTKTNNSITIDWSEVLYATSYNLQYKHDTAAVWTEITNVNPPYTFSGLEPCTDYNFQIHTQCADSTHGYDNSYTFRTLGCGACTEKTYCEVQGASSATEWIQSIVVNGFSNNTGNNGGWLQSNQIITALTPGSSYNMTFTPGYSNFSFDEEFSVWIDLNQDGIFDVSENLISGLVGTTSVTGILNIPIASPVGVTKMRVGMNGTTTPDICPVSNFYGEYEDYCVYIGPQAGVDEFADQIYVYPNPVRDVLYINSVNQINSIQVYDVSGKMVLTESNFSAGSITISDLTPGVYFLHLDAGDLHSVHRFIKN